MVICAHFELARTLLSVSESMKRYESVLVSVSILVSVLVPILVIRDLVSWLFSIGFSAISNLLVLVSFSLSMKPSFGRKLKLVFEEQLTLRLGLGP